MPSSEIINDIKNITPTLPVDQQLAFVKDRLSRIEDDSERRVAELLFTALKDGLNLEKKQIVFLVHGIRTNAEWQDKLKSLIHTKLSKNIVVHTPKYGFFNIFSFILPKFIFRWHAIRKIKKQLRLVISENPTDDLIVIAHSFGTYIITNILNKNSDIKLRRLLLCGSIVEEKFKWAELKNIPDIVLNDCGTKDYLPLTAKACFWSDYGSSGTRGFHCVKTINRYHDIGHSSFFEDDFMTGYWLPFIHNGEVIPSSWTKDRPSMKYHMNLIPYSLIFVFIILACLYYFNN